MSPSYETMIFLLLQVIGIAVLVSHLLGRFLMLPHDPKEPPLIPSRIPFIGHVIGLLRHGSGYYSETAFVKENYSFSLFYN